MLRHYEKTKKKFETRFPYIDRLTRPHRRIIKYVLSGGTAASIQIALLYICTSVFGVYYLYSSIIAWVAAFCISFTLQKFWTFSSRSLDRAHHQLLYYFIVAISNLGANTVLLYVFVERFHVHYLLSQIFIGLSAAVVTYTINKHIIFRKHHPVGRFVIVLAAPNYPPEPGGAATHAARYTEAFGTHGHEVRLVIFSRFLFLPPGLRHLVYAFFVLRQCVGADLIYLFDPISSGPAAYVAWLMRKKYIMRIGGDVVWERAAERGATSLSCREFYVQGRHVYSRLFRIARSVIRGAEKIIVPADFLLSIYTTYYGVAKDRITVIPNPLPAAIIPVPYAERSAVFASRLVRYKNLPHIIEPFLSGDINATLYILGDGPEKQRLCSGDHVKVVGTVSRDIKDEYLKRCMLTVAPALTEFNPNYVLEGFALGKPTLISKENSLSVVPALPEMMVFDPRSRDDFVHKMNNLLSSEGYKKAQAWVLSLSHAQTWEEVIQQNLAVIARVCAS